MNYYLFKRLWMCLFSFFLIIGLMAGPAFAGDFEVSSGGLSADTQVNGFAAGTGTGGGGGSQVNLSVVLGTGGASYLQGNDSVSPHVTLTSSEPVDLYVSVVFGDIILGYDTCAVFSNPYTTDFIPCFTDSLDLTLFDYSAGALASVFSEETFIPFGVFVRAVEAGTGINGHILGQASALTYIANLPPLPPPAQNPWIQAGDDFR